MRLLANTGDERVVDELRAVLAAGPNLDIATPSFSVFAFQEIRNLLARLTKSRMVPPPLPEGGLGLLGGEADRSHRNSLQTRWLAREVAAWLEATVEVRTARGAIPQPALIAKSEGGEAGIAITGTCSLSTPGLGITPSSDLSLVQVTDAAGEAERLCQWFEALWIGLPGGDEAKRALLTEVRTLSDDRSPASIYFLALRHLFQGSEGDLDEDRIIKSATGIRETTIWKKLFKFQRDGVLGAIDKLDRFGGCIIADSVGLGKTFEALAIIKYYELRNDRSARTQGSPPISARNMRRSSLVSNLRPSAGRPDQAPSRP